MARIALIAHGRIRSPKHLWAKFQDAFLGSHAFSMHLTRKKGDAHSFSRDAIRQGITHIICAGGDGTLNECVNGLMEAGRQLPAEKREQLRLALLPRGTGNDFSKTLPGFPGPADLRKAIEQDHFVRIDLGRLTFRSPEGVGVSRYFINIADLGLGPEVVRRRELLARRLGFDLGYAPSILGTLTGYSGKRVELRGEDFQWEGQVKALILANGRYFGGGLCIAPEAKPGDGVLELVIVGDISWLEYLRNLPDLRRCRQIRHPHVQYRSLSGLRIGSMGQRIAVEADGEWLGYLPAEVRVVPGAVKYLIASA